MMQKMRFKMSITPEQYQSYYLGAAKFVQVQTDDGRSLRFPISELQQFVGHTGIKGYFEIVFNEQHKLVSLSRVT